MTDGNRAYENMAFWPNCTGDELGFGLYATHKTTGKIHSMVVRYVLNSNKIRLSADNGTSIISVELP